MMSQTYINTVRFSLMQKKTMFFQIQERWRKFIQEKRYASILRITRSKSRQTQYFVQFGLFVHKLIHNSLKIKQPNSP